MKVEGNGERPIFNYLRIEGADFMKKVTLALLVTTASTICFQTGVFAGDAGGLEKKLSVEHSVSDAPLKLSEAQMESMHAIRNRYLDMDEPRLFELGRLHRKMGELMSGTTVNKDDLFALQTKINTGEAELADQRLRMALEMREVLTPEQRSGMHKHMLEGEFIGPGAGEECRPGPGLHGGGMGLPPSFGPGMPPPPLPPLPPPPPPGHFGMRP
jgi:Spy/CpxP family protein refolding chaperone